MLASVHTAAPAASESPADAPARTPEAAAAEAVTAEAAGTDAAADCTMTRSEMSVPLADVPAARALADGIYVSAELPAVEYGNN